MTYRKVNMGWHGVPRQEIKWFPAITIERCTGCGLCVTSCFRGVLAFDYETDQAVVVTPRMAWSDARRVLAYALRTPSVFRRAVTCSS